MSETNDELWLDFEALATRYPHDDGVRMTADLARWLMEERQRLLLPAPPILLRVLRTVSRELAATIGPPPRPAIANSR